MLAFLKKHPLALILTATTFLYLPTLPYEFVYDDLFQIVRNPRLFSWNFSSYFLHHVWVHRSFNGSYYRPLFLVWFRLNYWLFRDHPLPWHATTVLMHVLAVAMVYRLLRRTLTDEFVVSLATLVFALHPGHAESVAWISGVTDPLMTIPLIGALLCWMNYRDRGSRSQLASSLLLMLVSLLAKETAIILPALIFVYSYSLNQEPAERDRLLAALRAMIPFLLVFAAFWSARWWILRGQELTFSRSPAEVLGSLVPAAWFYTKHLLWPARLSAFYDFRVATATAWHIACGIALAVFVLLAALAMRRRPSLLQAWAWIVFPIAAAIGGLKIFSAYDCVHDRYLYLSAIGLGIVLGKLLGLLTFGEPVFSRPALQVVTAVLLVGLIGFGLLRELPPWRSNYALFLRGIRVAPGNPMPYQRMGASLAANDRTHDAAPFFLKAIQLEPDDYIAHVSLARIAFESHHFDETLAYCDRANQIYPDASNNCYMLDAATLRAMGRLHDAETPMRIAIAYWPEQPGQHFALGQILLEEGNTDAARQQFLTELAVDPGSSQAKTELAKLKP